MEHKEFRKNLAKKLETEGDPSKKRKILREAKQNLGYNFAEIAHKMERIKLTEEEKGKVEEITSIIDNFVENAEKEYLKVTKGNLPNLEIGIELLKQNIQPSSEFFDMDKSELYKSLGPNDAIEKIRLIDPSNNLAKKLSLIVDNGSWVDLIFNLEGNYINEGFIGWWEQNIKPLFQNLLK